MYYLFFELLSLFIEVAGIITIVLSCMFGFINIPFILFYIWILTLTAFYLSSEKRCLGNNADIVTSTLV